MQKCIRRGNPQGAIKFAKVAHNIQAGPLYKRLWTILLEDCALNLEAIKAFNIYAHSGKGYKYFPDFQHLVQMMAEGEHSGCCIELSHIIKKMDIKPAGLIHLLEKSKFSEVIHIYKHFEGIEFAAYDAFKDIPQWIIDFAELSVKLDRERLGIALPYFYIPKNASACTNVGDQTDKGTFYRDFLPLEAVDTHTRPGKMAYSIYLRNKRQDTELNQHVFASTMFLNEGKLFRNFKKFECDFCHIRQCMIEYPKASYNGGYLISKEMKEHVDTVVRPELNKIRIWVLEKTEMANDIRELEAAYKAA